MKSIIVLVGILVGMNAWAHHTPAHNMKDCLATQSLTELATVEQADIFFGCMEAKGTPMSFDDADMLEIMTPELIAQIYGEEAQEDTQFKAFETVLEKDQFNLYILVDVSDKQMYVYKSGALLHTYPVSTAKPGKHTPRGIWTVKWLAGKDHKSSIYGTPMPYTTNYGGGSNNGAGPYAIHGVYAAEAQAGLGKQNLSAGCVRTMPEYALNIQGLVKQNQQAGASIRIRVRD